MSGFTRGVVAVPLFLAYSAVALFVGGTGGIGGALLVAFGAVATGHLVGSSWALLIAMPFLVYGLATVDDPGPLENTDGGWGFIILLVLALPVAIAVVIGVAFRRYTGG